MKTVIRSGVVHRVPDDVRTALAASPKALAQWNDVTPLARNDWLCWVMHPKQEQTRREHVRRLLEELRALKRRPCCWPGCPHRNANARKWFK